MRKLQCSKEQYEFSKDLCLLVLNGYRVVKRKEDEHIIYVCKIKDVEYSFTGYYYDKRDVLVYWYDVDLYCEFCDMRDKIYGKYYVNNSVNSCC